MIWLWVLLVLAALALSQIIYWSWFIWGPSRFARRVHVEHDGRRRSYLLHVPKRLDGPAPLVLVMHGAMDWAKRLADATHWDRVADEEGFIVAFPEATHDRFPRLGQAWNAGHCCMHAVRDNIPDVEFLFAVRDDIARRHPLAELYLAGFSNGGMLAYRAAADHPDAVAGVAAVGSAMWSRAREDATPWHPPRLPLIPVVHVHGLGDQIVPYAGGPGRTTPYWHWWSVEQTMQAWHDAWQANQEPWTPVAGQVAVQRSRTADGRTPILSFRHPAGHSWPQAKRPWFLEKADPDLDAERAIWQHWRSHRRDKA